MQNNLTIDIISPSDDNYAQHLAVMIASVLYNSKEDENFNFYIMDSGISERSKAKILELKKIKDFKIEYVTGKKKDYKFCPLPQKHVINTYFRFEIPSFLPNLSKVLLLDSDLIVRGSLREFWETNLEGLAIGAVENPFSLSYPQRLKYLDKYGYFNAGVALMDLEKLREIKFEEKCFEFVKKHPERTWHVDQCVINSVLYDNWKRLSYKYNFMSIMPYNDYNPEHYGLRNTPNEEVKEAIKDALIAHFISDNKPWEYMSKRLYKDDYWKYLKLTPWKSYIPSDYNLSNIINKYLFSDETLNFVRKIFGKKVYHFIENIKIQKTKSKQKKQEYDKFKRENLYLESYKISLDINIEGYQTIEDLDVFDDKSWNKWFMTNSITEIISSKDFVENISEEKFKNLSSLIYDYLKFEGIFKTIDKKGEENIIIRKFLEEPSVVK